MPVKNYKIEHRGRKVKIPVFIYHAPASRLLPRSERKYSYSAYYLQTSLYKLKEKSMTQYQPDKDFNLNVFIIDMDGKAVERKQEKWEPRLVPMSGDLPYGCYLVVAWADCKGQRIGKCYHVSLGRSY